jgi:hypothetical protein
MPPLTPHAAPAPARPRLPGALRVTLFALALAGLGLWFFSPTRQIANPTLDTSNYASFAYFTARGFQYGTEVMHVGGPYGFIHYGFVHGGDLFWKRLPLELLTKLALGALVLWFFARSRHGLLRWIWLLTLLFMVPLVEDLPYDLAILFSGLCLLACHASPGRRARVVSAALAAFLALLTLVKGTHAVLSLATFGLLALQAWQLRDFRRLPAIIAAYVLALVGLLLLAGQNPLNFPAYLRSILEQSSGYNAAMVLDEPLPAFLSGGGALLTLEAMILLGLAGSWRDPRQLPGALLLAGFSFVEWKHGFVRADGHVYIFYQYACLAAPTEFLFFDWAPGGSRRGLRLAGAGAAIVAFSLGFWGDGWQSFGRYAWAVREFPHLLATSVRQVAFPARAKARLDADLATQRTTYALPLVRETVGQSRVDFFGVEHGYLTLNRLNYRPRPMGGGNFSVFNAWLQDANLRAVTSPATAPTYFITRVEMFDNRFLAQDDAGTLRALLGLYQPIDAEQGMVIFRRRPEAGDLPAPRLLATRHLAFEEPVVPPQVGPGEMLAIELTLPLNFLGRMRSLFYKAPLIFMSLTGEGIEQPDYRRIVPALFARPVILNPVLENTRDLVALYQNGTGKFARSLTLHAFNRGLFATGEFEIRFYALPRPAAAAAAGRVQQKLAFATANEPPLLMSPANAPLRRFDGLLVQMLEPPGRIRFALAGRENELSYHYGIDPEAYTVGRTDGVEFMVELERPGQPAQMLFRRWLRPLLQPADRGLQTCRVILPPFPRGSTLSLLTGPGPDGDTAWDWGFFTGIRLLGQGYIPAQFPRFSTVPVSVDADIAGSTSDGTRDLFMLNSPGSLTFALKGGERRLRFTAGLLPGAYTGDGHSDGVDLTVELRDGHSGNRRLFYHYLNPRDNPVDRGDRSFSVDLPRTMPGTVLVLSVGPGPYGSAAWDWAYIESLNLD